MKDSFLRLASYIVVIVATLFLVCGCGKKSQPRLDKEVVKHGDAQAIKSLIDRGADIDFMKDEGDLVTNIWSTPLDEKAISDQVAIKLPMEVKRNEEIPIHVEFKNTGDNAMFFNPDFDRLVSSPAGVLLFDSHKQCIGDLLDFDSFSGSHKSIGDGDWRLVKKDEVFAADTVFFITDVDDRRTPPGSAIAPGRYYVQLVFWLRFTAPSPNAPNGAIGRHTADWRSKTDKTGLEQEIKDYYENPIWEIPLYRSNVITIDVE